MNPSSRPEPQGLYHPANEHDACGVGFVAHIKGRKSHSIVDQGLTVLRNLTHRGAVGWDPKLSDGAGCLIQIPDKFFREVMAKQGVKLPPSGQYGVGMIFLPRDPASRLACEYEIERAIKDEGQVLLGWRDVPVDKSDLAEPAKIWPLIYAGQSDSASFDNALELLVMGGYSVAHAMMLMIPEAWENHTLMDPSRRAFYEYHAAMMEPWDGPASIAFTDGRQIGATLDRNGLRPSRYIVTADDLVIMGSECGCLPVPEEKIIKKWRLQPGRMFLVDLEKGRIIDDKELKDALAGARPYAEWIERIRVKLDEVESEKSVPFKSEVPLLDRQQAFAYTQEDIKFQLQPMAQAGEEPVGSMGNDASLAVLSRRNK